MTTGSADKWDRNTYSVLRKLIYLIAGAQFWYGIYFDYVYVHPPRDHVAYSRVTGFGGKLRYLTVIGAICQASYYTLSLINDFFGATEYHPKRISALRKCKDFFFATFAFPLAMNVGISFWGLYAIDRELILPKSFDIFFPNWLNHVMHTNIMVFIVLEMLASYRKYPARKQAVTTLLVFNIAYIIWLHVVKYMSGKWVYPVFDVLNLAQRIGFLTFMCVFGLSFYFVGEFLNDKIWANELKNTKSGARKHK